MKRGELTAHERNGLPGACDSPHIQIAMDAMNHDPYEEAALEAQERADRLADYYDAPGGQR